MALDYLKLVSLAELFKPLVLPSAPLLLLLWLLLQLLLLVLLLLSHSFLNLVHSAAFTQLP